ncbi:unnamed protein product [Symbiodinium sp. CCMP2592]|nr:unnamed protein product [Symbiodinium sp. CCMP2592]
MAPSSGGMARDYLNKFRFLPQSTPELSLPKVPEKPQVPYFSVWVDGRKLRFPFEKGNLSGATPLWRIHAILAEQKQAVMEAVSNSGLPISSLDSDVHVHANCEHDARAAVGEECGFFLCSCLWRRGRQFGVCFENGRLGGATRPSEEGSAGNGLQAQVDDDDVFRPELGQNSCEATAVVMQNRDDDWIDAASLGSALCSGSACCPAATEVDRTFLGDAAGTLEVAGGGQFLYQTRPTREKVTFEPVAAIQDYRFAEVTVPRPSLSDVAQAFSRGVLGDAGGGHFAFQDGRCSGALVLEDGGLHLATSEPLLGNDGDVGTVPHKEMMKTREGQRSVVAASPSPRENWSKEENQEPERPLPSPNPPPARSGLPSGRTLDGHGKQPGGQFFFEDGGWETLDANTCGAARDGKKQPLHLGCQCDFAVTHCSEAAGGELPWETNCDVGSHGLQQHYNLRRCPGLLGEITAFHDEVPGRANSGEEPGPPETAQRDQRYPGPKGSEGKSGFNLDIGSILGPDFASNIRAFIEAAVQKAIQEALQGLSLGDRQGSEIEQPGPKRRKRQHGKASDAPAGEDSSAASSAHATQPDRSSPDAKGKAKGAKGGAKGPGNGQSPGNVGKGRGKEGGKPAEVGNGRGKGDGAKGKDQPRAAEAQPTDEWQTVDRRKPQASWSLRSSDWTAPAVNFDAVADELEKTTGVYKAVVLCGPGQADLLATLLLGSKRPHGVVAVTPDHPDASARCPGAIGNSCVFKQVHFHHISTAGIDLPGPKVAAARAQKVMPAKTAVLYVRIYKRYVSKATWKDVIASPQRAFHTWVAQQHMKVQDSWGWAKEQAQGEDHKVYALFRVPEADVTAFVALSGRDGIFIDPPRWISFPSFVVQWAEKEPKESDLDFLQRAITRMWMLEHAPFDWSAAQALEAVSSIFAEVTMTRQQRTRKGINFFFKAAHTTDHDVVALPFDDGDQTEIMWCRWAPVRARPQAQTIRTNGSWSLLPPRDPFGDTTKVAQVVQPDEDKNQPEDDAAMKSANSKEAAQEAKEAKDEKEAKRGSPSKGTSTAKRTCTETRDLPKGMVQESAHERGWQNILCWNQRCCFKALGLDIAFTELVQSQVGRNEDVSVLPAASETTAVASHDQHDGELFTGRGQALHWKCPICNFGIVAQDAFSKSADAVTADKRAHCTQAHPDTSWKKFKALDRASTIEKAAVTRRGRECIKRLSKAKGTDLEGFRLFCWPRAAPSKTFKAQGGLAASFGWMCLNCCGPFRTSGDALSHAKRGLCNKETAQKKAKRRVKAIDVLAKAHGKNTPPGGKKQRESKLLQQVCTVAEADINQSSVAEGFASSRCAAGIFDFQNDSEVKQVLIAAIYAQSGNPQAASAQTEDILAICCHSNLPFIVAGDFNLEPHEAIVGEARASGAVNSLDDAAQGAPLPATGPGRKRRIDFGLCHWSIAADAIMHFNPEFSDHASVGYQIPLNVPDFHVGPLRRSPHDQPLEDVAAAFASIDCAPFREALNHGQLDRAWNFLSACAETCLCHDRAEALPRHQSWMPRRMEHQAHPALQGSATVKTLTKLQRQLAVVLETGDPQTAQKVVKSLPRARRFVPDLPWVSSDFNELASFVDRRLLECQDQEAKAIRARWKELLRDDSGKQRTFVKTRADAQLEFEKRSLDFASAGQAGPVHPSVVVRDQTQEWIAKWQAEPQPKHEAIDRILQKVPTVTQTVIDLKFEAEELRAVSAAIADKAAGPDGWFGRDLRRMPISWWVHVAALWQEVWDRGVVPDLWRSAKVVLIKKKGGPATRPITLTQVIWRIGTKIVAKALRKWTPEWATECDHGGLAGRSICDVLSQIQAALHRGTRNAALLDIAGYFDSLCMPAMHKVFKKLGAPMQLAPLLDSFYCQASRYFCFAGSYDEGCHVIKSGFAQGCPLSPIAAAALSHCWSAFLQASCSKVGVQVFMDDRTLVLEPSGTLEDLERALSASAAFDDAFSLRLSADKCYIAAAVHNDGTQHLARRWHFKTCTTLDLLGVSFEFDGSGALPKFSLRKAVLRLRLLRWTQAATRARIMLVRSLVIPCLAWASGFARPTRQDLDAVRSEVRHLFSGGYGGDTATVAFYELLGWGLEPAFALDLGLCKLAWRWIAKPPVWHDLLPLTAMPTTWIAHLPQFGDLLHRTGWWTNARADTIFRRDASGGLRKVCVGFENFSVLKGWLEDFYRGQFLLRCRRIAKSLHREAAPNLAQGLDLQGPPAGYRVTFQGHRVILNDRSSEYNRRAAFLSGGTTWFYNANAPQDAIAERCSCMCGNAQPSRSHLLWVCPKTSDLRNGLSPPQHRGEERLLSKHVPEQPPPPPAVDPTGLTEELAEAIATELQGADHIVIATDGSAKNGIAAHAAIVNRPDQAFAGADNTEDQSSFRAELCGLRLTLEAVLLAAQSGSRGHVFIAVDCEAALKARFNCQAMPLFGALLSSLVTAVRAQGVTLTFLWVPAHGRHLTWRPEHPALNADHLRVLNSAADQAAKACVARRLRGSLRERWHAENAIAKEWEVTAVRASAKTAERLHEHLKSLRALPREVRPCLPVAQGLSQGA